MEITGLGGGVMLAIAAALWLMYLLPNWLKNREYLATEKNAVRLQQTIRVLAETSEVPRLVRADAAARRAANGPVAVGRAPRPTPAAQDPASFAEGLRARRLRRTRALTSLVLLAALITLVIQLGAIVAGGAVAASWLVVGASVLVAVSCLAALGRLAEVARARTAPVARVERRTSLGARPAVPVAERRAEWTPVAVPKPVYLSRSVVAPVPVADPAFELEIAAAAAERALRSREQPPSIAASAAPAVAPSRFASMGIVGDASTGTPDLDAVLARRRATG